MKRTIFGPLVVAVSLIAVLGACAPAVAPPAPPAPAPAAPPAAPALSPNEAAWQKVVAAARKEGKLISYNFFMVGDIGARVKRAFKERTGLDVEFITGPGASLIERIKAERRGGFPVASTLGTGSILLNQAKLEGLTEAPGPLPELLNKEVWKRNPSPDKEGHLVFPGVNLQSPWVNSKLVKPGEEPKSWRDLLQPRWKGKIAVSDPDTTSATIAVYYFFAKKANILDDAYFRELGKTAVFQPNNRMSIAALTRGDVDIDFVSSASVTGPVLQAAGPVKAISMEEGILGLSSSGVVLLSQAPHPNATRVFINWYISQEGQSIFSEAAGTESTRQDVPNFLLPPAQLSPTKVIWYTAEDDLEIVKIQRERVFKNLLLGK